MMVWRSVRGRCGVAVAVLAMAGGGLLPVGVSPAMAAPAPPTVTIVRAGESFRSTIHAESMATCPSGSRLTGGGGKGYGEAHFQQLQPRYAADGTSSLYVFAQSTPEDPYGVGVAGYAVCVHSGPATQLVTATGTAGTGRVSVTVPCPEGTHVLGGGAALPRGGPGTDSGYLMSSFPASDLRSWNAAAASSAAASRSVTGYAICAQPGPATQVVSATPTQGPGNNGLEATAACPVGTHITGGGGDGRGGYLEHTTPHHRYDPDTGTEQDFDEWRVRMRIRSPNIASIVAYAVCESDTW